MNLLESLKRSTTVVADTGDIEAIAEHKAQDATTNPSLLFQAAQKPQYQELVDRALHLALSSVGDRAARKAVFMETLLVTFGCEILKVVPGRVSTEVDANLSFDTEGTLAKAHRLIDLYRKAGIDRDRVLIKIASTWEGSRDSLQPDTALQLRSGCSLCRGGRHSHLTFRRANLRLVPQGPRGQGHPRRRGSGRRVCHPH